MAAAEPWNHNIHYHSLVLRSVPAGTRRALDVGCGHGLLTRELGAVVPEVVALDRDALTLEAARKADGGRGGIEYALGDFLSYHFEPGSFDFICAVAALHHMDAAAALQRMRDLLRPGGRLAIIGHARFSIRYAPADAVGFLAHRLYRVRRQFTQVTAPICWPPPHTYAGMRRIAATVLPGSSFRRRLLFRYSLVWTKPGASA